MVPLQEVYGMGLTEARLTELGITLPQERFTAEGVRLPFPFVKVDGTRVFISGHGPMGGTPVGVSHKLGKVGQELSVEEGYLAARYTAISILGSLKLELGNLDRIRCWHRIFGMVNSAPGFTEQPSVINGFSDLILEVFGAERGKHTRSAVGMSELPFNIPVEIEGELAIFSEFTEA
ncbi:RidA family protein [Pseudomonas putida]|uniref:RidA family protein n=1 Tax=Pseudomonas putida TaxID=303 RepID=UPI00192CEA88|nr:RidA family protein [Pseudomonas putida]